MPLPFRIDYCSPAAPDAAFSHWQFVHQRDNSWPQGRVWHRSITVPGGVNPGTHDFDFFRADLRCEPGKRDDSHDGCSCVGARTRPGPPLETVRARARRLTGAE